MTDTTTATVADNATQIDALDLQSLTVIGIFQAYEGPVALLRSGRGEIARVTIGNRAFGKEVTAIDPTQVILRNFFGQSQSIAVAGS